MTSRLFVFRKLWPLGFYFNTFMYQMDKEKSLGIWVIKRLNYLNQDSSGRMLNVGLWWFRVGITWNIPL